MQADERGYFGEFGGRFVPETLVPALDQLVKAYEAIKSDKKFWAEFAALCRNYVGRPTPLFHAEGLTRQIRRRPNFPETGRPGAYRRS